MVEPYLIIITGKSHVKELSNALESDSAMMSLIFCKLFSHAGETFSAMMSLIFFWGIYFLLQEKLTPVTETKTTLNPLLKLSK